MIKARLCAELHSQGSMSIYSFATIDNTQNVHSDKIKMKTEVVVYDWGDTVSVPQDITYTQCRFVFGAKSPHGAYEDRLVARVRG